MKFRSKCSSTFQVPLEIPLESWICLTFFFCVCVHVHFRATNPVSTLSEMRTTATMWPKMLAASCRWLRTARKKEALPLKRACKCLPTHSRKLWDFFFFYCNGGAALCVFITPKISPFKTRKWSIWYPSHIAFDLAPHAILKTKTNPHNSCKKKQKKPCAYWKQPYLVIMALTPFVC